MPQREDRQGFDSVEEDKLVDAYTQGEAVEVMIDHHVNGTREYALISPKAAVQLGEMLVRIGQRLLAEAKEKP